MKTAKTDAADDGVDGLSDFGCEKSRTVDCICPKCGAKHRLKMLWTGRGVPRKFCPICKHYSTSISDLEPAKTVSACF
jgi:hypothetical protein